MDFISNKKFQNDQMLKDIGVKSVNDLFEAIPPNLHLSAPAIDDGLSEYEGLKYIEEIAHKNTYWEFENYLGAGAYEHHIPALTPFICEKSEFLTSYTPYQAEASQGTLQTVFEYQSAICALTGQDVANASVYDATSAAAEAVMMALRHHKDRHQVIVCQTVHPHSIEVIQQYLKNHHVTLTIIDATAEGKIDTPQLLRTLNENVAAVVLQSPNFFGVVEDVSAINQAIKKSGALFILSANPLSYGLFKSASELGSDIAVGDTQPFGLPLQFGGPTAGYIACKDFLMRQLPGRIVGETTDAKGQRGFVLTLQAREQHIRREKATSNICSNQELCALASLVTMLWYGKEGGQKVSSQLLSKV